MSQRCDYCRKGRETGNMVSHAKNRLKRFFLPNLQKLKVLRDGMSVRVKFCTSCIQRLKKDGRIGSFYRIKYQPKVVAATYDVVEAVPKAKEEKGVKEKVKKEEKKEIKKEKKEKETPAKALKLEDIVGKKIS